MGGTEGHKDQTIAKKGSTKRIETPHHSRVPRDSIGRTCRNLQNILAYCDATLVAKSGATRGKRGGNYVRALHPRK
jgi:hypothetical protein